MKRSRSTLLTAGIITVFFTPSVFAASSALVPNRSTAVSQLDQHAQRLDQHVQTTTGGGRQTFVLQRRQVQDLIARIKAGESVDPREIDKLLRESPQ